ncbi:hypothetical protein EDB85DRAFT_1980227 [Lactarius pseudohatsudake]|nr:hypothetical protein EDB85DRAFT_1980227 [Lactarius pseudohatsudake]
MMMPRDFASSDLISGTSCMVMTLQPSTVAHPRSCRPSGVRLKRVTDTMLTVALLVTSTSIPPCQLFQPLVYPPTGIYALFMSADLYGPSSSSIILSTCRTPLGDHSITTLSPRRTSTGAKPRFILEYFSFSSVFVFASRPCPSLWPPPSLATPSVFPIYYLLFVTPPPFHSPRISSRSPLPLLLTHFPLLHVVLIIGTEFSPFA